MPNENSRLLNIRPEPPRVDAHTANKKLQTMPLTVLLPPLGSVQDLFAVKDSLTRKFQESKVSRSTKDGISERAKMHEASMLAQVIKWLSAPGGE